ncbi:SusC/RagA family TonB-linked outer membrane protein [Siphonobacter curvatus]|uniref:SusC/RagA family TonB-linked outer membrane protein n=1 Tax=Siphonobacter curvatus TaxID=2094562 RepID=A0A2S7IHI0_9BACT|nr:TonB-dependent receptor [Siphonobacter curvatus]PQA55461.1 SusC/RagA family TonB-linked outer membrane protein [Siphonobacter curvatus]
MKPILPVRRYGWVLRCIALAALLLAGTNLWALPLRVQTISGKVTDEKGEAMAGVSVREKNTVRGTITDAAGRYQLTVTDGNAVLVFSYVGYLPQEVTVGKQSTLDLALQVDPKNMQELVVVGYGTQKKANLTGAVSQVGAETLESRPIANISQGLQGAVPGMNVTFGDGRPGSAGTINIRGYASINSSTGSPLILIDGVPGSLNSINPRDVESISVLKDAASASIYGARGAFGVVLVTTKKAKGGRMSVNYGTNFGFSTPTVRTDFITDGYTSAKLNDEAFIRATGKSYTGYTDEDYEELRKRQTDHSLPSVVVDNRNGKDMYIYYGNTDWWRTMFRDWSPSMEHNLSFSGGNDKTDYLVSGRYYQKRGVMRVNQDIYNAYNFRAKLNTKVTDWFTLNTNTQFNANDYSYPGWGVNNNFVSVTVHALPSYVPVNPDGTATYRTELNNYTIGDGIYADLLHGKSKGGEKRFELTQTIGGTLQLGKHITAVGSYSYTLSNGVFNVNRSAWESGNTFLRRTPAPWSIFPGVMSTVGYDQLSETSNLSQYHVVNAYATYDNTFGDHAFKAMVGYNQELYQQKSLSGNRKDLLSQDLNDVNLGSGAQEINGGQTEWALLGYFTRINYDYRGKYLLELNGRYDGTSRFRPSDRFGFFPSVSAGWRVSEESFFEPIKSFANEFKIRASYGSLGNQQVANYAYLSTMSRGTSSYLMNGQKLEYLSSPAPISSSLTWEKATSADVGVDVALLRNKLNVSYDWYRRATTRMLTKGRTLPTVFGATEPRENAADLLTKGFELSVNWKDRFIVGGKPFSYNVGVVLSDYKAEITRFDNPTQLLNSNYVGQQLGEIWGYTIDGMFGSDEEAAAWQAAIPLGNSVVHKQISSAPGEWGKLRAGDLRYVDINGDGKINVGDNTVANHGDLQRIGNSLPRYSFGVNLGANWGNCDLSAFFQGIGRQNWYPGSNADKFWGPYSRPYYSFIPKDFESQIWTPENTKAYLPVLRGYTALNGGGDLQAVNNRYLQNLAYVRLKNLTLGYSLPSPLLQRIKMARCRIYVSGENMFTLTQLKTSYIDPEMAAAETNGRVYPFSKVYSFGLDISF